MIYIMRIFTERKFLSLFHTIFQIPQNRKCYNISHSDCNISHFSCNISHSTHVFPSLELKRNFSPSEQVQAEGIFLHRKNYKQKKCFISGWSSRTLPFSSSESLWTFSLSLSLSRRRTRTRTMQQEGKSTHSSPQEISPEMKPTRNFILHETFILPRVLILWKNFPQVLILWKNSRVGTTERKNQDESRDRTVPLCWGEGRKGWNYIYN